MQGCNDPRCPVHGNISIRGNMFTGVVVGSKADKTVRVRRKLIRYVPKYERYKKTTSVVLAHNPKCIDAREGETVRIAETRRLSKRKAFVVVEKVKETEEKYKKEETEENTKFTAMKKVKEKEDEKNEGN